MKKTTALLSTLVIMGAISSPASASETQDKNQSYYYSISDEKVYAEYKAYCNKIGNPIRETEIKDGIIKYDFIAVSNALINYNIIIPSEFEISMPLLTSEAQCQEFEEKTPEYFGFDMLDHNIYFSYYGNNSGKICGFTPDEKNDIYDCMRNVLTVYNSDFFAEYGKNAAINFMLVDGPSMNLEGDVNLDNKLTLADAVMILQHIGNPDKFPMLDIGAELGDVVGNDGITNLDALTVQRKLLKLE